MNPPKKSGCRKSKKSIYNTINFQSNIQHDLPTTPPTKNFDLHLTWESLPQGTDEIADLDQIGINTDFLAIFYTFFGTNKSTTASLEMCLFFRESMTSKPFVLVLRFISCGQGSAQINQDRASFRKMLEGTSLTFWFILNLSVNQTALKGSPGNRSF